jgi:hypothetical protein
MGAFLFIQPADPLQPAFNRPLPLSRLTYFHSLYLLLFLPLEVI